MRPATGPTEATPVVNPGHDTTTGNFAYRGGVYGTSRVNMVSAYRYFTNGSSDWSSYGAIGFRVCFPAQ